MSDNEPKFEQYGGPDFVEWCRAERSLMAYDWRAIHQWAETLGMQVASRGGLSPDVVTAYREAHSLPTTNPLPRPRVDGALLPRTRATHVVRTDFTDDEAWRSLSAAILAPTVEGFVAGVELLDDAAFLDLTPAELLDRIPEAYGPRVLFIADERSMAAAAPMLLAVDLETEPGLAFRASLARVQSIDDNIAIANMWFRELAY
jgi:hypothetical protein